MNARLSDGVQHDLREALLRYERARPGLGGEFLDEVEVLIARIEDSPEAFPLWRDDRPYRKAVMTLRGERDVSAAHRQIWKGQPAW